MTCFRRFFAAGLIGLAALFSPAGGDARAADAKPVLIGFDGEYGLKNSTSAQAIELGIRAAIHEINAKGGVLGGRPLELVVKDNRSVPSRGIANLKAFAAMPDLVAVFGGRFSPVLLQQIALTHELTLPLLDVWAAADGITDHEHTPSYTFRLSLKDSWAMPAMVQRVRALGKTKVGVLLPNTGWGRSNLKALTAVSATSPVPAVVATEWYNWGERDMLSHYKALLAKGAEALLLVANDIEGALLVRQLGESPATPRVPIVSHWGVTGGDMVQASGPTLADVDFAVVQTFSFATARPAAVAAFMKAAKAIGVRGAPEAIDSPVGVGHAYDMTHILAKAIDKAGSTDRAAVRDALEAVPSHRGLVRDYAPPFAPGRHDALSPDQVFLARFGAGGVIVPLDR